MLVLNADKDVYEIAPTVDLMVEESASRKLEIARSLEPGAYGIDPAAYFL